VVAGAVGVLGHPANGLLTISQGRTTVTAVDMQFRSRRRGCL